MGEAILLVAVVNAAMLLTFLALLIGVCRWFKPGTAVWFSGLLALHAEALASLAFNYTYLVEGGASSLNPLDGLQILLGFIS